MQSTKEKLLCNQNLKKNFYYSFFHTIIYQFFLQEASKPFAETANFICERIPKNPERTVALRKLLEAKDCAVRAVIAK